MRKQSGNSKGEWFATRLLFGSFVGKKKNASLVEDRIVLIRATDLPMAIKKAKRIGKQEEHSYKSSDNKSIDWRLLQVLHVQELSECKIEDGTEVYFRLFSGKKPIEYLRFLQFKRNEIET